MNYSQLTGRENKELFCWDKKHDIFIHKAMKGSLEALRSAAASADIDIGVASGYRDYQKQVSIWNAKASGKRKLLDRQENPVDFQSASQERILEAILTWSAIPGASRHHWGTEIDIYDKRVKNQEDVQLTRKECERDFSSLYKWLENNLEGSSFHRPYQEDLSGVAQEPWHLSYSPLSKAFERAYSLEVFERNLIESKILLKDLILKDLERIFFQYVVNVKDP